MYFPPQIFSEENYIKHWILCLDLMSVRKDEINDLLPLSVPLPRANLDMSRLKLINHML